ncbi:hypothetical protein DFS34DRAFT_651831 [Phlyctochytrium arcticum]|nr:hypothetical protein DFS34DRAFT_651831 [Phlyctochytrium arcticum]
MSGLFGAGSAAQNGTPQPTHRRVVVANGSSVGAAAGGSQPLSLSDRFRQLAEARSHRPFQRSKFNSNRLGAAGPNASITVTGRGGGVRGAHQGANVTTSPGVTGGGVAKTSQHGQVQGGFRGRGRGGGNAGSFRGGGGGVGGRGGLFGRGRGGQRGGRGGSVVPSKTDLDAELEQFMAKDSKTASSKLDMELDDYMTQDDGSMES